jgi:D-amino-acid oxidase
LMNAGGEIRAARIENLEDLSGDFALIVNCSGVGAKLLAHDAAVEPHRGQVAIVPKIDLPYAVVCDDAPLMYAIPRANDCVFGGSNEVSDNRNVDQADMARIIAECSRALNIAPPKPVAQRVGLRPFRKSGVRVEAEALRDGRVVIHDYGHGGSGFTLSWGCAQKVLALAGTAIGGSI